MGRRAVPLGESKGLGSSAPRSPSFITPRGDGCLPRTSTTTMSSPFRIVEHVVESQHIREYPGATANEQEEPLNLAVKQYIPLDNPNPQPGDVTILAAHANGFPKVCYSELNSACLIACNMRLSCNPCLITGIGTIRTSLGGNPRSIQRSRIPHSKHLDGRRSLGGRKQRAQ